MRKAKPYGQARTIGLMHDKVTPHRRRAVNPR